MRRGSLFLLAAAAGLALSFSFPEPDVSWLAWVCLAPLLAGLRGAGWKRGLGLGLTFGLLFFGSLLSWIALIGWGPWFVLVLLQAAFLGLFGLAAGVASDRFRWWGRVLWFALAWVAIEYVRGLVPLRGFTWGQLAQGQTALPHFLEVARVGGGWAVAALVVALNASIAEAMAFARARRWRSTAMAIAAAAVVIAVPLGVPGPPPAGKAVRVALVQGNIPREMEASYEKDLIILGNHERRTEGLATEVDLVVWPESSVGIDPLVQPEIGDRVSGAARAADAPMIVGGNREVDPQRYAVMAYLVNRQGVFTERYQKTHLVPFGEYVPARRIFGRLPILEQVPRDAVAGSEPTLFDVAGGKVAPVLSYEGDFGPLVRDRISRGGRMLVVATNTSTWGDSWASAQHLAFSRVRAVENGVWVVHAALTGISAFVDPEGDVVAEAPLWTEATLVQELAFASGPTFYTRTGDWLPVGSLILGASSLVYLFMRSRRQR